jgi:hypothetical protein
MRALRRAEQEGVSYLDDFIALADIRRPGVHIADLQILAIAFYRLLWRPLARLDPALDLDALRSLDAADAAALSGGFVFAMHLRPFPIPQALATRIAGRLRPLLRPTDSDAGWMQESPLPLGVPQVTIGDPHQSPAANAIRNTFFAQALVDELGGRQPPRLERGALVIDLLLRLQDEPSFLPPLRQLPPAQATFRLGQLALALLALHQDEIEEQGYGAVDFHQLAIGCLLAPLASLTGWLRTHRDGLLVPIIERDALHQPETVVVRRPAITTRRAPRFQQLVPAWP